MLVVFSLIFNMVDAKQQNKPCNLLLTKFCLEKSHKSPIILDFYYFIIYLNVARFILLLLGTHIHTYIYRNLLLFNFVKVAVINT